MSTIIAEAPTLGRILHNTIDGLALLGGTLLIIFVGIFYVRKDFERLKLALLVLAVLIIARVLLGSILFPAGQAENPQSIN